jgi:hypothetical protein
MNPAEYTNLNRVEKEHWYYVGKRDIVRFLLNRFTKVKPDSWLLEQNLRLLHLNSFPFGVGLLAVAQKTADEP